MQTLESCEDLLPDGRKVLPYLTPRQMDCLRAIYCYAVRYRDYPRISDVAMFLGVQPVSAYNLANNLIERGYVTRVARFGGRRSLRLTPEALEKLELDCVEAQDDSWIKTMQPINRHVTWGSSAANNTVATVAA